MRVEISSAAERDIGRLSKDITQRIILKLRELRENARPPGCLLLQGYFPRTWRIRVGDWRIIYDIDDDAGVVTILRILHRSKAYLQN